MVLPTPRGSGYVQKRDHLCTPQKHAVCVGLAVVNARQTSEVNVGRWYLMSALAGHAVLDAGKWSLHDLGVLRRKEGLVIVHGL